MCICYLVHVCAVCLMLCQCMKLTLKFIWNLEVKTIAVPIFKQVFVLISPFLTPKVLLSLAIWILLIYNIYIYIYNSNYYCCLLSHIIHSLAHLNQKYKNFFFSLLVHMLHFIQHFLFFFASLSPPLFSALPLQFFHHFLFLVFFFLFYFVYFWYCLSYSIHIIFHTKIVSNLSLSLLNFSLQSLLSTFYCCGWILV